MTTIEEMFGPDSKKFAIESAKAHDIARKYRIVAEMLLRNEELLGAVRDIGGWLLAGPSDQLLNDFALQRDPLLGAKVFGQRCGVDMVLAELTDPKAIQRTLEELNEPLQEE